MPTITLSRVWVLIDPEGVEQRLTTMSEFTRACQLYQSDPVGYRMEQRDSVTIP